MPTRSASLTSPPRRKSPVGIVLFCLGLLIGGCVIMWWSQYNTSDSNTSTTIEADQFHDEDMARHTIQKFSDAFESNDFGSLATVFADYVTRYHRAYNLSNYEVVEKYKNYDSKFGVYGKHISVRWNTLQVDRISEDELSVVYIEDFSIDRFDKTKCSEFVLERHLILDNEYKIKSIYDANN